MTCWWLHNHDLFWGVAFRSSSEEGLLGNRADFARFIAPLGYDSPWKEALERYFKDFMAFFFPTTHAGIDWTRGYKFLVMVLPEDSETRFEETLLSYEQEV